MTDTLGDALPREMARVRDELLPAYDAIPTGLFIALDRAARAALSGDLAEMIRSYEELKGFE